MAAAHQHAQCVSKKNKKQK